MLSGILILSSYVALMTFFVAMISTITSYGYDHPETKQIHAVSVYVSIIAGTYMLISLVLGVILQ